MQGSGFRVQGFRFMVQALLLREVRVDNLGSGVEADKS